MLNNIPGISTPKGAVYFVKGRDGYLMDRNGGVPHFLALDSNYRHLAPRFTLRQAEQLAKICCDAGHACDVSTQ